MLHPAGPPDIPWLCRAQVIAKIRLLIKDTEIAGRTAKPEMQGSRHGGLALGRVGAGMLSAVTPPDSKGGRGILAAEPG